LENNYKNLIEKNLEKILDKKVFYQDILFEAAKYSLLSNGKRLRPLIVLNILNAFEKEIEIGLDSASAIEMVHSYSLIHDDLPAMDNDDYRRGKLSLHKKYSEWVAILTGDFLLTYSFEVLSDIKDLSDLKKIELIKILSRSIGAEGMLAGQVVDILSENKKTDEKKLLFMHENKTAKLFMASFEFGAVLSDADINTRKILKETGLNFGLYFQFMDDINDEKISSSDISKNKSTVLTVYGSEKANIMAKNYLKRANYLLDTLKKDFSKLKKLFI